MRENLTQKKKQEKERQREGSTNGGREGERREGAIHRVLLFATVQERVATALMGYLQ